jgi:hypothetical protein
VEGIPGGGGEDSGGGAEKKELGKEEGRGGKVRGGERGKLRNIVK